MILLDEKKFEARQTKDRGRGVFAKTDIEAGALIADYLGKLVEISKEEEYEKKFGYYGMFYNDIAFIFPSNTNKIGAHTVNHSCSPNCFVLPHKKHILYIATRKIFKNEEITIGYDDEPPSKNFTLQHPCCCKSPFCRGTMYVCSEKSEKWYNFSKKINGKNFNKLEVAIGEEIKALDKYPTKIDILSLNLIPDIFCNFDKKPIEIKQKKLLSINDLRKKLSESGVGLNFVNTELCIIAITGDGIIISKPSYFSK